MTIKMGYGSFHETQNNIENNYYYDYEEFDIDKLVAESEYLGDFNEDGWWTWLCRDCIWPVLLQSSNTIFPILFLSILFQLSSRGLEGVRHLSSAGFGIAAIIFSFPDTWHFFIAMCSGAIAVFFLSTYIFKTIKKRTLSLSFIFIVSSVVAEFWLSPIIWHAHRGPALLLTMKVVSVAAEGHHLYIDQLAGYLLCPGTVVFGPWIKFSTYASLFHHRPFFTKTWFFSLCHLILFSSIFLLSSVCLTSVVLTDYTSPEAGIPQLSEWLPLSLMRWVSSYRDAFAFRASHYYVSYASQATLIAMGLSIRGEDGSDIDVSVSHPLKVEFPRSLVEVVVFWNIPMHHWLKDYIFRPLLPTGVFLAVIATYLASALLHGLNFQLGAVLMSLGLYSYIEHALRCKLARVFDACVLARACKGCQHSRQAWSALTLVINGVFSCLALFHLAYLGVGFSNDDSQTHGYSMSHVLDKWGRLGFGSHLVALATFVFYLLI